jgi:hypothetical protein
VKFTIEIYTTGDDGSEVRLSSAAVSAMTPLAARKEAVRRLAARQKASAARVLNAQNELLYQIEAS